MEYAESQLACAFFPPLALQMATGGFIRSYGKRFETVPVSRLCWIMFADVWIYSFLAWYCSQVWPSKIGVRKPFYFLLLPSYWFPKAAVSSNDRSQDCLNNTDAKVGVEGLEQVENGPDKFPQEDADESLLGAPAIFVNQLRKSFGSQTVVSDLTFKMYENQIFALLGHNGAGKVSYKLHERSGYVS